MTNQSPSNVGQTILLSTLGFEDNPFAYTNADEEERLKDYFIPPPYFHSVFGDPDRPKSFVVFAPRGGGKSAQRIMVENQCATNQVLAVTYDEFEFVNIKSASEISLHHHLQNIIRKIIMHILVEINFDPSLAARLSKQDRETFVKLSAEHFTGVTDADIRQTLDSLKSVNTTLSLFYHHYGTERTEMRTSYSSLCVLRVSVVSSSGKLTK